MISYACARLCSWEQDCLPHSLLTEPQPGPLAPTRKLHHRALWLWFKGCGKCYCRYFNPFYVNIGNFYSLGSLIRVYFALQFLKMRKTGPFPALFFGLDWIILILLSSDHQHLDILGFICNYISFMKRNIVLRWTLGNQLLTLLEFPAQLHCLPVLLVY